MTYLEEYFTALTDGKIPACEKMKLVSEKILEDLYNPGQYHFDEEIASRHIDFIEKFCKVPSGNVGGAAETGIVSKSEAAGYLRLRR